jgi:hypothetical protein
MWQWGSTHRLSTKQNKTTTSTTENSSLYIEASPTTATFSSVLPSPSWSSLIIKTSNITDTHATSTEEWLATFPSWLTITSPWSISRGQPTKPTPYLEGPTTPREGKTTTTSQFYPPIYLRVPLPSLPSTTVVNSRGNPWVKISYPYPYPPKPIPLNRGMGFGGYG